MRKSAGRGPFWGFLGRFTLVHVLTYFAFGIVFSTLMRYQEHFASPPMDSFMRSFESPWLRAGVLFQFIRGPVLALPLYPFRKVILESRWGWLKLWALLWVLTSIGAVSLGVIEGFIYTKLPLKFHFIGLPEVTLQMLVFSWVFATWQKHADKRSG